MAVAKTMMTSNKDKGAKQFKPSVRLVNKKIFIIGKS